MKLVWTFADGFACSRVDFGRRYAEETLMADKPTKGLADVVAASTALSDIDGKAGRLFYRGYDIHELAGRTTFEETAHLLQCGSLPTREQLTAYGAELVQGRALGALVDSNIPEIAEKQGPMEALR